MKVFGFDIETAKVLPPNSQPLEHLPLGISCAAIATSDGEALVFHGEDQMTQEQCENMLAKILSIIDDGYRLVTYNGCSFDLRVLAQESGREKECAELALGYNHCDMMFHFLAAKGFMPSLNNIAIGMGFKGKTEGVSGEAAPAMWKDPANRKKVLEYVEQDARLTMKIYKEVEKRGALYWRTRSGRISCLDVPIWLPVSTAMLMPMPDTGWLERLMRKDNREPPKREEYTGWAEELIDGS